MTDNFTSPVTSSYHYDYDPYDAFYDWYENEFDDIYLYPDDYARYVNIVLCILAVPGHICTVLVICSFQHLRRKCMNIFIVNHSVLDIVLCVAVFFMQIFYDVNKIGGSHASKEAFCVWWVSSNLLWSLCTSTFYNYLCLTVERYVAITRPQHYDEEKIKRYMWIIIIAIWCIGFLTHTLEFVLIFDYIDVEGFGMCILKTDVLSDAVHTLYYTMYAIVIFFGPATAVLVMYTHIAVVIRRVKRDRAAAIPAEQKESTAADASMAVTLTIIVVFYMLCNCWHSVNLILLIMRSRVLFELYYIIEWLVLFNAALNPFMLFWRFEDYRRHFRLLLCAFRQGAYRAWKGESTTTTDGTDGIQTISTGV